MPAEVLRDRATDVVALMALADTVGRARRQMLTAGRTPRAVEIPAELLECHQQACRALYGHKLEWFFQLPVHAAGPGTAEAIRVL